MLSRPRYAFALIAACVVAGCAAPALESQQPAALTTRAAQPVAAGAPIAATYRDDAAAASLAAVNRITWGATASSLQQVKQQGLDRYLERQLNPRGESAMPAEVQARIAAMRISQEPLEQLVGAVETERKDAAAMDDVEAKQTARRNYQRSLARLGSEAATRSLLRAIYSEDQLQEQLAWFWMNHFNVFQGKANLRAMIGDYEERAIRPHVLGRFRDLVAATVHHPAMLRYLDNERNAVGRINENYARELMELHTLGVDGGYTQKDVQELARVLTGLGINQRDSAPRVRPQLQSQYVRDGLFEFNPNRHDYGAKQILGAPVRSRGLAEVDEVIDRLCRHPSTARFVSRKLAMYFVADDPPAALVERMTRVFVQTDGNIAAILRAMFASPEFAQSLGGKFKDPLHYVVSAVRVAYGDRAVVNAAPMLNWLNRLGQPLHGRQTPDGYPLDQSAWASPGQMTTRFEIARLIASGAPALFKTDAADVTPAPHPVLPQLADAAYYRSIEKTLSASTAGALDQAGSRQEWNTFLLASPEFMIR
jgi:uncharacterized protein (DUF1800 family)